MDDNQPMHATIRAARPARRRGPLRLYASLLSVGVVVVLGLAAGKFVVPPLMDSLHERQHIETLLDAAAKSPNAMNPDSAEFRVEPVATAMNWWTWQVIHDRGRRDKFLGLLKQARSSDRTFAVLGQVIHDAELMDELPADLRLRWFRLVNLSNPSPQRRAKFIDGLLRFPPADDELKAALTQASQDPADEVAAEAAYMLPAWANRPWALELLGELLGDERARVRQQAAQAVGLVADELGDSAFGRAAIVAFRGRLLLMAAQDPDVQTRAYCCWALFRLGWMAKSGFELFADPQSPAVHRMAALFLSNPPIASDHTEPIVMQQSLEMLASANTEDLPTRQRAGIALAMLPMRAGLSRPIDPAVVCDLIRAGDWATVAIGCRLAGLAGEQAPPDDAGDGSGPSSASPMDLLLARITQSRPPDFVNEQIAWSLGAMAIPPFGRAEDPAFKKQRDRAVAALVVLGNPRLAASRPDADIAPASPRTRLAVAKAAAAIGDLPALSGLAEELLPAGGDALPDTLADMACLELARLLESGQLKDRKQLVDLAINWAGDYSERLQRSGVLLLALLNERSKNDWLLARYNRRLRAGGEPLTTVYQQLALLALGVESAEQPAPAVAAAHLEDPTRRTPGVYAMLTLAGRRAALDALLGDDATPAARTLLDDWRLADHLAYWVRPNGAAGPEARFYDAPGAGLHPIPAPDPELAGYLVGIRAWWYGTHSHRLTFDAKERVWRLGN